MVNAERRPRPIETFAVVLGAVVGSLLVSFFKLQPIWLWGMGAGLAGGLGVGVAVEVLNRRWSLAVRIAVALLVVAVCFGGLYLLAGWIWITDPRNFQVRPPGS